MAPRIMKMSGKQVTGADLAPELSAMDKVQQFLKSPGGMSDHDRGFTPELTKSRLKLTAASAHPEGTTTFEFTVTEEYTNYLGSIQGGAVATLFDICTTTALIPIAREGFWEFLGVTRNLNITYLRPALVGCTLEFKSTVVHAGKRLVTIQGVARRKEDSAIMYMAEHLKAEIEPPVAFKL
ncbi:hypothetical protein RUND412_004999 [Rhizina undulata]